MLVQQILNGKSGGEVYTLPSGTSVSDAARLLSEKRIGAVIISDDGTTPLGILSERDIVRELGKRGAGCMDDRVERLMTHKLVGCAPEDEAHSVLMKMTEGRFRHMPVMQGETMVGLISIGDVVKARLAELAMERDALEGMVMGY
ncbi:CBS domain-containing protein [Oceaniglobus roseus]|uniref:CBS domain-containing protein n=1 Tax=Oceaniglobus roseus TaxID=1737570 RepID=UPI000C7EE6E1|nr:CBS domain-containing protein [Kandeliimicrobium roseum]